MLPKRAREKKSDQYHHYIPRFILRRYQVGPVRSKAERQRLFKKTGVDPEYVHYWDVAKGTLDLRPIGQVYGEQNLYRDCKNMENVNAIEQKLSVLETRAATVIRDLHTALLTSKFSVKRRQLEDLRKFTFILHYRKNTIKDSYFDEDLNGAAGKCIKHYRQTHGFDTPIEAWLGTLQYYLDNSHSQIMTQAAEITDKYSAEYIDEFILGRTSGTEIENIPAITYQVHWCTSNSHLPRSSIGGVQFSLL